MAAKERKCLSCSTTYRYCPSCSSADKLAPAWKSQFCSESCMTLWTTLTKFVMNRLSKVEAKEIISLIDLKPMDSYASCIQRDYEKVMAEEPKPKRNKKIELPLVEEVLPVLIDQIELHEVVETTENDKEL